MIYGWLTYYLLLLRALSSSGSPHYRPCMTLVRKYTVLHFVTSYNGNVVQCAQGMISSLIMYTVEPLNNGHIGGRTPVLCREVVPIIKVAS